MIPDDWSVHLVRHFKYKYSSFFNFSLNARETAFPRVETFASGASHCLEIRRGIEGNN